MLNYHNVPSRNSGRQHIITPTPKNTQSSSKTSKVASKHQSNYANKSSKNTFDFKEIDLKKAEINVDDFEAFQSFQQPIWDYDNQVMLQQVIN